MTSTSVSHPVGSGSVIQSRDSMRDEWTAVNSRAFQVRIPETDTIFSEVVGACKAFLVCWFVLLALALLAGCATPKKSAVKTLRAVGLAVDAAYRSWNDLIVTGQLTTNSVPRVSMAYVKFQGIFSKAVVAVQTLDSPATTEAVAEAGTVLTVIGKAKGGE